MRAELSTRADGAPYEGAEGPQFDKLIKATANRLLAMLVASDDSRALVSSFRTYKVDVSKSAKTLLTSDRPVTVSAQLIATDAFMVLPYAPYRLLILAHREAVFAAQDPTALVGGINSAIVEQSDDMVIAADRAETEMVDHLFLRPGPDVTRDSIGLIRRESPLIEWTPFGQRHSRHDKASMRSLGR